MDTYQKILEEVQHAYPNAREDMDELILKSSEGLAGNMLFLNVSTGSGISNGKKFSFDTGRPETLGSFLRVFDPRYIILAASSQDNIIGPMLASPESLKPVGDWGGSLWEVYKETYDKPMHKPEEKVRLKLLFYALVLSRTRLFKMKFFEKSVLNIFGWLYEPETYVLKDLYLDVFFSFDEKYLYADGCS